jgi:DNA-binding CsgD family transcriptional regulator
MQDDPQIYSPGTVTVPLIDQAIVAHDLEPERVRLTSRSREPINIYASIVKTTFDFVPCTGCILSVHDTATNTVKIIASHGAMPAPLAGRAINAISQRLAGSVAIDLNAARAEQKTPILQANLLDNGGQKWILSVVRNSKYWNFERREVHTLLKLRGMFRTSLRERVQAATLYRACWSAIERLASGIALLYPDGTLAGANKSALALLDSDHGLIVSKGKICCPDAGNALRLREALDEIGQAGSGECRAFMIEGDKGTELLQVNLIKLSENDQTLQGVNVAAFISDPTMFAGPSVEYLQELYRLTRVEAEVVQLICQGLSPAKAAEKLRISVHTVRGYLKAIFAKIGCNRQADIVRLVGTAPRLIPSAAG